MKRNWIVRTGWVLALGWILLFSVGMFAGCAANQEQAQETRQPVYQDQPTQQSSTQQAATDGPSAVWAATTNPHGRGQWGRHGYKDLTDDSETADFPPEFFASASPDVLKLYVEARMPGRLDYSVHGNTVTQTVTGEMSGQQSNAPSSSPQANPSTTGTTTGGASDQRQQPTASTAIDIPVAAGPGSSATGGTPNASAAGPYGTSTGGTNSNTPTSTGNNTATIPPSKPSPETIRQAVTAAITANPSLAQAVSDALATGVSPDHSVNYILQAMAADPQLDLSIRALLPPATTPEGSGNGNGG